MRIDEQIRVICAYECVFELQRAMKWENGREREGRQHEGPRESTEKQTECMNSKVWEREKEKERHDEKTHERIWSTYYIACDWIEAPNSIEKRTKVVESHNAMAMAMAMATSMMMWGGWLCLCVCVCVVLYEDKLFIIWQTVTGICTA